MKSIDFPFFSLSPAIELDGARQRGQRHAVDLRQALRLRDERLQQQTAEAQAAVLRRHRQLRHDQRLALQPYRSIDNSKQSI